MSSTGAEGAEDDSMGGRGFLARSPFSVRRIAEWVLVAALLLSVRTCRRRLLASLPAHVLWTIAYAVTILAMLDPAALLDATPEAAAAVPAAISEIHRRVPWGVWAAELCLVTAFFGWMVATSYRDARLHEVRLSQRQIGEMRRELKRLVPALDDDVRDSFED